MHAVSSITMTPHEPNKVPFAANESKSIRTSHSSGRRMGTDEPPGMMPVNLLPLRTPPQTSFTKSIHEIPNSLSTTAGRLTRPLTQHSFGPGVASFEPMPLHQPTP